jgi:hypothetical protein
MQLNDVVLSTIQDFVNNNALFTALDVSNKVKESLPFARHREVRDLVRTMFTSDIEPSNYAKTPIQVTLGDGSTVEALLYHPLVDSWDLDSKYDTQMRAQTAAKPGQNVPVPVPAPAVSSVAVVPASQPMAQPLNSLAPTTPANHTALNQWQSLFQGNSLFPRR